MADKTSTGVSKLKEWKGSSVMYKVNCACSGGECDSMIDISFDKDFGHIDVEFYKTIMWGTYYQKKWWWEKGWLRIKMATQILFKGFTEHEGSFMLEGEDHLNDFITALQEGRDKVKQFKIDFDKENEKI
jgi:hypothetical protein